MNRWRCLGWIALVGLLVAAPAARAEDARLAALIREHRIDRAFQEVLLRLAHDPTGVVAYEALTTIEPALARYSPSRFRALARRARTTYARNSLPSVALLEAMRRLVPTPDGFHDPRRARATLRRLVEHPGAPVQGMLARWVLARDVAPLEPGRGAEILEELLASPDLPPRLRAMAQLFFGVCLARAGEHDAAAEAYRLGLEESGELAAPEGGTLEPFFRHGLADVLRAAGLPGQARPQLEAVVGAERYPAREAARRELAALE